jgi:hypothetical protein
MWLRLLAVVIVGLVGGCGRSQRPATEPPVPKPPSPFVLGPTAISHAPSEPADESAAVACPTLTDVHAARGVVHAYGNGERGRSLMVEAIGGGAGWLDFDRDRRPDLYLNQGGDPTAADRSGQPLDRIFRNLGPAGFEDVTAGSRVVEQGYGQGVAVGDLDNDGFDDVYVTNVGGNTLLENMGDGTFLDVTAAAGVADGRWSSSAAWADLDLDGDLDLYVCNYLVYDPAHPIDCRDKRGEPRICHPRDIEPWPDECYVNEGDGSFRPAARELGLHGPGNKALGVAVADFTNDGLPDVYVANDTTANFLFVARGDGTFRESALALGCAVDRDGHTQASMGLAVGDYDGNGWLDVYSTHFHGESNTLYRNLGPAGFEDVTGLVGLHEPTLGFLGFGAVLADFDRDGLPELLVANGHIENYPGNPLLRMTPQLFSWRLPRWRECGPAAGPFFAEKQVGRGVAVADYDTDGVLDAVVVHQNAPAALLENQASSGDWLAVRCIGIRSNRRGIGCRVTVRRGDRVWMQEIVGGSSYASTHEPLLVFGLGEPAGDCEVTVRWPGGGVQQLRTAPRQSLTVLERVDGGP